MSSNANDDDRVALARRAHPLLARHRLGMQVDRGEAEARRRPAPRAAPCRAPASRASTRPRAAQLLASASTVMRRRLTASCHARLPQFRAARRRSPRPAPADHARRPSLVSRTRGHGRRRGRRRARPRSCRQQTRPSVRPRVVDRSVRAARPPTAACASSSATRRRSRRASKQQRHRYTHLPEDSDHATEHAHLARADRLHRLVLRLQAHVVGLLEEALDRRLLAHERDDDLAVGRRVLRRTTTKSPSRMPASSSSRRAREARTRRPRRRRRPGRARSPRCSPRRASAGPRRRGRRAAARCGRDSRLPSPSSTARSSNSIARGFDGSRRSRPTFSRFARCACTVEDDASPTALPMSRTVGG